MIRRTARSLPLVALLALAPAPAFAWGALAISQGDGGSWSYGVSYNHDSPQSARADAMARCRSEPNGYNCRIVTTFNGQCISVAFNPRGNGYGWATRPNVRQAQAAAHNSCLDSNPSCRVVATHCDG
jgi:hypothetical protein